MDILYNTFIIIIRKDISSEQLAQCKFYLQSGKKKMHSKLSNDHHWDLTKKKKSNAMN